MVMKNNMRLGYSDITYENSGVSIVEQNIINSKIIKMLNDMGMRAEGLFAGAVDISSFKNNNAVSIDMSISGLIKSSTYENSGIETADAAFRMSSGIPIGTVDYIASSKMGNHIVDFVKGVAVSSLDKKCSVLGGECAEMPGIYKEGRFDAFVHVLSLNNTNLGIDIKDIIKNMEKPLLFATTDGTGTKTKIVKNPADIIYHGFNDLLTQGVKAIAFGLYISGNTESEEYLSIEKKAKEIAEQWGIHKFESGIYHKPDDYNAGDMDIAGTVIGIIDSKDTITKNVSENDVIIGINVDGLMTSGYSLARKFVEQYTKDNNITIDTKINELDNESLRQALSKNHRPMTDIFFGNKNAEGILSRYHSFIHGASHITGGGQKDNITRMIPDGYIANVLKNTLFIPKVMELFQSYGIPEKDLYSSLNMGVGFAIIVSSDKSDEIINYMNKNFRYVIKDVDRRAGKIGYISKGEIGGEKFKFVE